MRVVKHRQWTKYIDNNDNQNIQTNNEEKIIKPFDTFKNISMKNDQQRNKKNDRKQSTEFHVREEIQSQMRSDNEKIKNKRRKYNTKFNIDRNLSDSKKYNEMGNTRKNSDCDDRIKAYWLMLILIAVILPKDTETIFNIEKNIWDKLREWMILSPRRQLNDKYYIYQKFLMELRYVNNETWIRGM
ncbi:hypothetical protein RCL_jg25538.t1 [Rhizophagus clarus]|uniref:Uncharacterized protein n=1 Tax=Rhizophagus clarus TaxID=94130 RepID=A0A8H3QQ78_9GLOM|nr:hypothetical protein RCL_jg25538.t1 [Rhizophagus clarus]